MQFQWSKKKCTLKDLIAQSKDKLPVIFNVAEGYSGSDGDDAHDIAAGSVFFFYAAEVQSRIVALTEDERYLSMSRSCPVNFHVILNDRSLSQPCRLNDIVLREHNNLGDLRIQMAAPEAGGLGPMDAGCSDIQGTLRVLDLYDERYLLCHSFIEGTFWVTEVVSVPSYLPLTVVLATGIKHGSRTDFKGFLNQVNASALKYQQEYAKQPRNAEEIVVFSDPPNGDYEYIDSTNRVSRIPSLKIVDTTRNPETEVIQSKDITATSETRQGEFLTVPRLPPRNLPRSSTPVERPKLEEKVSESRVTWTTSRRPLPPVPDQTGRGSSVTDECWCDERKTVERKPEAVKSDLSKKSILPLKTESRFLKGEFRWSPSHSPIFLPKFGNIRSALQEVMSDSETLQRGRSTGNAWKTKAPSGGSATSGHKPEVQKNNQSVTWSSWSFTSLKRNILEEKKSTATSQKIRPPVAKKPSVQPKATKQPALTSRSSTGALKELDESFLDVSKNCVQRPGTLTLVQLDSSGYEGDYESYYDEINSPITTNRLSQIDQSSGTVEETPQQDYESGFISSKQSVADNTSETLLLRSTDNGLQGSGGKSESENELDSSYEEISLPSSRTSSAAETASDSGVSSAPTNVSTLTLDSRGVHNFINVKHDLHSSRSKDIPDTWLAFKESLSQGRTAPLPSKTKPSWRHADDVPIDIASLSVEQVSACLTVLNLSQYMRTFREQQIDGALLSCLDRDVLISDFGFRKFDAIKLAKFARDGWRPKMNQEDTPC